MFYCLDLYDEDTGAFNPRTVQEDEFADCKDEILKWRSCVDNAIEGYTLPVEDTEISN